jgi:tetratricopeptide (TPR) repeat protein
MLAADDPDFEAHLGELTDILSAGNLVDVEDAEFLEEAIAKVPTFADGYMLLAKAYVGWEEPATALETLLDGQKHLPDDLDILELLSRLLWESGQRKLAFEYLNKGLAKNPTYVPLLALTGQYLFEDGQEEEAKSFLARAEVVDPRHPALNRVRLAIAKLIGQEVDEEID